MLSLFKRPVFWITVTVYVLLTIGVLYFVFSPVFRPFVEQNQQGFLRGYFSNYAGFGVVNAVIEDIGRDVFLLQQVLGVFLAIVLWRRYKPVAFGILMVILTFICIFTLAILLFALSARHGY
jgi:hypothetical protein